MIRLNANELPWQPSEGTFKLDLDGLQINRYPDATYSELKTALSAQLGLSPDQITFGNGSDELIWLSLAVLLQAGDTLVTHAPTFGEYERMAALCGVKTVYAPIEADFTVNLDSLLTVARRQGAKLVVLCRPNNPTGELIDQEKLLAFLNAYEGYVLLDEAYIEFANAPDTLPLLKDFPNLLILRTFSKAYGLAGLRLGYGLSSASIAKVLNESRPPYNVNILTEAFALSALSQSSLFTDKAAAVTAERERFCGQLSALKINFMPSAANFVLLNNLKDRFGLTGPELAKRLLEKGFAVRSFNEAWLSDCLRLTVGSPEQNKALIEAIASL